MTLSEFLHMGGYGFYVWSSFGLAAVVLAANLALPLLSRRRLQDELRRRARTRRSAA
jgi:heme exporter protein D